MIEEYIANNQFQDALDLLNDMSDETTRYQRLVCLYGLGEYQQAKAEGMLAKAKATNTYYDVVSIYVATLKEIKINDMQISHEINFIWRKNSVFSEYYQQLFALFQLQNTKVLL